MPRRLAAEVKPFEHLDAQRAFGFFVLLCTKIFSASLGTIVRSSGKCHSLRVTETNKRCPCWFLDIQTAYGLMLGLSRSVCDSRMTDYWIL
jgi:hypothetical protein